MWLVISSVGYLTPLLVVFYYVYERQTLRGTHRDFQREMKELRDILAF